ncbi:hypothetical protein BCU68_06815 [Vibrio sp. 10N.286.49.B3]|uniref:Z-ring associated protein ZapG n=1 Tax=Vibrio sp. 10N.286.49.B3 TaxID=1880855 RepID=UPI000C84F49C|nr:Z-ring associated protein ZapG [Vibrio sp. 10N.286.49.B3]PMH39806.1 hypothetical protein BCU68_06815 [Vibrio sp. 10N.286.49.B3]
MPWVYAIVGLVIGVISGVILCRFTTPQYKNQKNVQKDLETAKFALEQQRQELSDHFAQTAEMLDTLGKDYTKLYQHMSTTASELLPNLPEQDNPFIKKVAQHNADTPSVDTDLKTDNGKNKEASIDNPPKDYVNGATGLFTDKKPEIIKEPELVTAKAS